MSSSDSVRPLEAADRISRRVPAVSHSIGILERLADEWPRGVATAALVSELRMTRSTCYNILETLRSAEWVTRLGGHAGWTIGPRMFALTNIRDNQKLGFVQSAIEELSQRLGCTVFVAERGYDHGYVVIARADRSFGVRITVEVGDRFPFDAPALMYAFEAWTDPGKLDTLIAAHGLRKFTENSVTQLADVHRLLANVREDGFAQSVQAFDVTQTAVAAPLFDATSRPVRVIAALAFSTNLGPENVHSAGVQLRETAAAITYRLGGTAPTGD